MSVEYRPITPDEFPAFARTDRIAFGLALNEADLAAERSALELDRTMAAFEAGRVVGTTAVLSLDLTVPGGAALPAGGLTWTSVLPTHRRRGVLTAMIARQLDASAERGEPLSLLLASESTIYERFGYGAATYELGFTVDTAHSAFRPDAPATPPEAGCEVIDEDDVPAALRATFDLLRPAIAGSVGRTEGLWKAYLADPEHHRDGAGGMFHVLHRDHTGAPDGYASYRIKSAWVDGLPAGTLVMQDLMAVDPGAHAALWRFCLDMDLVSTVSAAAAPTDEPLRRLLRDPRRLRVNGLNDGLWVRLLDVERALGARAYGGSGHGAGDALTIQVLDAFRPSVAGRYELQAGPDGAACARTTRSADLALSVSDLGAAYLGAVGFGALARAGRVDELTEGAAARADHLFRTERPPYCSTHF